MIKPAGYRPLRQRVSIAITALNIALGLALIVFALR
jgi:hypothetical protein